MDIFEEEASRELLEVKDTPEQKRLVFPMNVYEYVNMSSGLTPSDKRGIIISLWLFASAIVFWVLMNTLSGFTTHYFLITLLIFIALEAVVGSVVLGVVFDVDSLNKEMDKSETAFSQYFNTEKAIKADERVGRPWDTVEFTDGTEGLCIQCRLGYNTETMSETTYDLNKQIVSVLNNARLRYRIISTVEDFKTSKAAKELTDSVKNIQDPKLFEAYRGIIQNLLNIASEQANVPMATYLVYAKSKPQKENLIPAVTKILRAAEENHTCYRSVEVLDYDQTVEFYQNYTKLKVLDMGQVRAKAAKMASRSTPLRIMKIYGEKSVYSTSAYNGLADELLSEYGLPELNKK